MGDKSDSRSRKWMITINNPLDKGFTHDKIKEVLTSIRDGIVNPSRKLKRASKKLRK